LLKAQKLIPVLVVAAGLVAYQNSFTGSFVLDDIVSIRKNPTIVHLWPVWPVLSTPQGNGLPVKGRPLINLSLAVNYALGGYAVWGYHALNLAIHILAGLTLLGVVRRTLLQPTLRERFGASANGLALATGVLWVVHPLQTESVTYVIQRAESIMGLLYLLTMYCFIRGAVSGRPWRWYGLCVTACALGMASKEVMVSAPLMVMLYDRTFVSGSFREAWRRRGSLYLVLAGTWLLLAYLVTMASGRGGTAGFGGKIIWWQYALTQSCAITHYLALAVWPRPLVFDYGTNLVTDIGRVAPCILVLGLLLVGTGISAWRWPAVGFLGCWFFAILAPSSSIVPVATQTMAEHRMYLPVAAVIAGAVMGGFTLAGDFFGAQPEMRKALTRGVSVAVAFVLTMLTIQRNNNYHSEFSIWQDTAAKCPDNPRAHTNLGFNLQQAGRLQEAIGEYEQALRFNPDYVDARLDLASVLLGLGRPREAAVQCREALRLMPNHIGARVNLGNALLQMGKLPEAITEYEQAVRIEPDFVEAHNGLGSALFRLGRFTEATQHWDQAVRIKPDYVDAHLNLGIALLRLGRVTEATEHCEQVVRLRPNYAEGHYNLGVCLAKMGRIHDGIAQYEEALRLKPDLITAQNDLAWSLATHTPVEGGDPVRAVTLAQGVCDRIGNHVATYLDTLAAAYAAAGRFDEAIITAEKAIELARTAGQTQLVGRIEMRLGLYQTGRAYYQSEGGASLQVP
jgi:tetratricopeptide (TPR) repeat protein